MKDLLKKIVLALITAQARAILKKYDPYIIAVTGSVGKTSAKDAIYEAIQAHRFVRKSEKSMNSEFGVPLTILGMESGWHNPMRWARIVGEGLLLMYVKNHYPKVLVLEVGADHPGDIRAITAWLKPHVAVIAGIPDVPAHLEFFSSADAVAEEKKALAHAVRPGGHVLLNDDDARARAMYPEFKARAVRYGFGESCDARASHAETALGNGRPIGMRVRVDYQGSSVPFTLPEVVGKTHVYPVLAAVAVAHVLSIDLVAVSTALSSREPTPGRMRLLEGKAGSVLIDDTYNSSPAALSAALDTLQSLPAVRRIAVLGDMLELGAASKDAHRRAGEKVARIAHTLITVGDRAHELADAAVRSGMPKERVRIFSPKEAAHAGASLAPELIEGDVVLIKGSQSMRMERAVEALLAEPERAKEFLVRQSAEWKSI